MRYLIFLLGITIFFQSHSQRPEFRCLEKVEISSEAIGDTREIWIGLPNGYDSSKTYSTLYLLDAEWRFDITYALSKELFESHGKVPELIVVGIPQIDWPHRKMDMTFTSSIYDSQGKIDTTDLMNEEETGGGLRFLKHLEEEVIPYINQNYSANGFNVLMGHSLGGYFGAYALPIQKSFTAIQIYDPSVWYNAGDAIKKLQEKLPKDFQSNVFVSSGLRFDGPRELVSGHLAMIDTLSKALKQFPNINLGTKIYPDEDHSSMYMYSVIDGLSFLFKDCEYGFISVDDQITLEKYLAFYKAASDRMGFAFHAPIDGIRWVGYANYHQENWEEALKAYAACYDGYQEDIMVLNEMAECHLKLGNSAKAAEYEEKAKRLEMKSKSD